MSHSRGCSRGGGVSRADRVCKGLVGSVTAERGFIRKTLADQVAESLQETILKGEFSGSSDFPSSRQLANQYGISHNVMLKALQQLQDDGLIYLDSKRQGYKVRQSKQMHTSKLSY